MDKEQVYINLETKYSVNLNTHVYVKDIGEVYCSNDTVKKNVEILGLIMVSPKKSMTIFLERRLPIRY